MATKPSVSTEWATNFTTAGASGNPNKSEPTTAFKEFGQPEALPVDRQSLNYELNALDQWKEYFEAKTDELSLSSTANRAGLIEIATAVETNAGTDGTRAVTPINLKGKLQSIGWDNAGTTTARNLSNLVTTGSFSFAGTDPDSPVTGLSGNVIVVRGTGNQQVIQIAILSQNTRSFKRRSLDGGSTWADWVEDYTTKTLLSATETSKGIAEIANTTEALGITDNSKIMTPFKVFQSYASFGLGNVRGRNTTDWNTATLNGFYESNLTSGQVNVPTNEVAGWQGFVSALNSENIRQIVFKSGSQSYDVYMRWGDSTPLTWGPWIKLITEDNIAAYIPNQVNWEKKSIANLSVNTKNLLDLDTITSFNLPALNTVSDNDFITVRPTVSSLSAGAFQFTINSNGTDILRTRDLDKNVQTDTALTVDFITEITFIKVNGAWEY